MAEGITMNSQIIHGDSIEVLSKIEASSVHCSVTSPPYFGLRDYGVVGQIGLEQTPDEYVAKMVSVFREVRRVLREDGTLWLNLGDSYASNQSNNGGYSDKSTLAGFTNANTKGRQANNATKPHKIKHGLKHKDLVGIPWRVAFALQSDGWYLRQDIIWAKPNPMPESVTDRCTKSHEYLFLLTKSPKYYFDHEAIREGATTKVKDGKIRFGGSKYGDSADPLHATKSGNGYTSSGFRNKRDVWTIPTRPFKGAHFAVFPEALVEPCILAGSKDGDMILDPFAGSGTTLAVAKRLGRNAIGIELNKEYVKIAEARVAAVPEQL